MLWIFRRKPKTKVKYLFFDFDGTISDARKLTYETLIKVLDRLDYKFSKTKTKKLMGERMEGILSKLGLTNANVDAVRKLFYAELLQHTENTNLQLCVPVEPLYELKKAGYELIVISNSESSFLKASMKKLKIKNLFHKVYGAEGFRTKDELLKKLFKKYKIQPLEAVYIGDRFSDVDYAKSAGCLAVAIHNKCSWSTKKEILSEKPDYIIQNFDDLKKLIGKINC